MTVSACAVAGAAAGRAGEIDVDLRDTCAGQVVDRDVVGAAQRGEVDRARRRCRSIVMLADVAGEAHALAVGRDVDLLVDVGAVELHRVDAVLAFDGVAAVARVPDERVVAGAEERGVVAAAAGDEVVAVAADQRVVTVAAGDGVVAGAAVDR